MSHTFRHDIGEAVRRVLDEYHERIDDERQRFAAIPPGETPADAHLQRMMAVGPATGRLLNVLARSLEAPRALELGTSFGYSTVWLAEGCKAAGGRLATIELYEHKSNHAWQMAEKAGIADAIDFHVGDALELIPTLPGPFDFVLFDHWKSLYLPSFMLLRDRIAPGAILVADNMVRGGGNADTAAYARAVREWPGMSSVMLPVGSGVEVSRYLPD